MHPDFIKLVPDLLADLLNRGLTSLEVFESALYDELMELGRAVMRGLLDTLDSVVVERAKREGWREKAKHGHRVICRFGPFRCERSMMQRTRNGSVWSPLAAHLDLPLGFVTPLAARLSLRPMSHLSTRATESLLGEFGPMKPSRTTLMKLLDDFGARADAQRNELLGILAELQGPPPQAATVSVQLDGVMTLLVDDRRAALREQAKKEGRKAGGPIGAAECSVGALVYYDADGVRLRTVRAARMPQPGKEDLKQDLRTLLAAARKLRPDLTVVALSDGAPNHWSFLTSLDPDYEIVDFYHCCEHIQRRLNRALGVGTHANQAKFKELRAALLAGEHDRAFELLEHLERARGTLKKRKTKGRGAQPTFRERHAGRMEYAKAKSLNLPIGSGVIEGTARHVVVDRLRQTGMRWKRPGGQAVLDLRCAVINQIFGPTWRVLYPERPVLGQLEHGSRG